MTHTTSSNASSSPRASSRGGFDPRRLTAQLVRARVALYALLVVVVGYHLWRYDVARIPAEAVSPLEGFAPGARLIVDKHPGTVRVGDAVIYEGPDGELLLGRIEEPPPSAPEEMLARCRAGAHWIVKERPDARGADSTTLGPIDAAAIQGRIAVGLPW